MMMRVAVFACAVAVVAGAVSPARADDLWAESHGDRWRATHEAIYATENEIARLEADPYVDDGYKAPVISGGRAAAFRLRATLYVAHWRWASPCCYSRKPIRIR